MLPGLTSRWMMPWLCACSSASQTSSAIFRALSHGQPSTLGAVEMIAEIAAAHVLADQVEAAGLLDDIVDGHDVGVVAEPHHRIDLEPQAAQVEALGLYGRDGDLAPEFGIASQIDALVGAFAEEALEAVASLADHVARRERFGSRGLDRGSGDGKSAGVAEARSGDQIGPATGARRGERNAAAATEPGFIPVGAAALCALHLRSAWRRCGISPPPA